MAKNPGKTRVTKRTVIEETGGDPGEPGGGELDLNGGQPAEPAMDAEEMGAIEKLRDLAGGDSGAMYEVRRLLPSAEAGYCGTLSDEEMSMERIAEEWGAGTYNVRVRLTGGKFAGSSRVQIAPIPKHRQPQPLAPVASQPQPASDATAQMIQAMQRGTDAQISMLSSLVKSLIERPLPTPPTPPPPPDTLAILATAKQLFAKGDSGDSLAMFMKGLEFGKDLGGDGDGDGLGSIVAKGFDTLKELSASQPQPRRVQRLPPPGTVPATEPARLAPPAAAPTQLPTTGAPMNTLQLVQWLGKQTKHLLVQASRQKNPSLYAEVFLDNLPDGLDDAVMLAQLKAPDAVARLAKLDARVLQFPEWFEIFRGECVRMLEEGPDDEDDDGEADDDGPDGAPGDIPPEFPGGGEGGAQ